MALMKVRYTGLSDVRVVNANDPGLKARGISIDKQLRWDRNNLWSVHVDGMSEQMEAWLKEEGTFTIEEVDAETGKTVKTVVKGGTLDDTGATVVDGSTGQVSTAPSGSTGRGRSTSGDSAGTGSKTTSGGST